MDFFNTHSLPDSLVKALCSALLHSLWQGILLAIATGLVVVVTRRARAAARYNALLLLLGLYTLAFAVTLGTGVMKIAASNPVSELKRVHITGNHAPAKIEAPGSGLSFDQAGNFLSGFVERYSTVFVLAWLLVVTLRIVQLGVGLQDVYRLRRHLVFAVSQEWNGRLARMAHEMGVNRVVRVMESGLARAPMAIGYLKPLILVPVGLLSSLSTAEAEAVLFHELAHIYRRDYLANLLMSLAEILFFFNPAVHWISALIRDERENCCDDMVLRRVPDKKDYIRALVACQEYQSPAPAFAMQLHGKNNVLLSRVKRMVSNRNQSLNGLEKGVMAACLLMVCVLTVAFSGGPAAGSKISGRKSLAHGERQLNKVVSPADKPAPGSLIPHVQPATVPDPASPEAKRDTVPSQESAAKIRIFNPGDLRDNTTVSCANGNMQTVVVKLDGTLYQVNRLNDRIASMQVNAKTIAPAEYGPHLSRIDQILQSQAQLSQLSAANTASLGTLTTPLNYPSREPYAGYHANYQARSDVYQEEADERTKRDRLVADLVSDGVIQSPSGLTSFKLSTEEFIVNGRRMPQPVYERYKKAYVKPIEKGKKGTWAWYYNFDSKTEVKDF
ncbi:M56 family metallopeptidase [Hufsiella ginkgonis]|uniref:M48 family metalloprotease n=1 Tax=Hufsiella ginkgonis TaxID=2695274 RepID=A0A7K1XTR2_9SPHI|nr:M56 family metallopeptidase [Hufsiella ginkgonis]MXV14403.1 M48 family metalloprotease [Hufsiella ginkgonis]